MIYADTDFFLAIIKKEDWLKSNAQKILSTYKGEITTNCATLVEIALVSNRLNLNMENIIGSIFDISAVQGISLKEAMEAAHLIESEKVNVFDAFHAVLSRGMPIISSDGVYEKIGRRLITLR